jgi:NADH:ubiquinone oxidoreductase subunit 5 (subunit L)/multisubunit Na+/H+ antiporter MnhA subunit
MSVAWTTILIIALLLPGVFFFIGYATRERYTREIVKSSAIGDVGWAIFIAIIIHLLAWGVLSLFGFDLASNIKQFSDYENLYRWQLVDHAVSRLLPIALYILATAISGLLLGCAFAWAVANGWLPFLATHKWINEVMRSMRRGLVTAYVMTTTKENKRVLMYKGILAEFYLSPDGKFVYVVLKTCSRYYMKFEEDAPTTSEQLHLFGARQADRPQQLWDYLLIDGANIANILFDPSPQISETDEGKKELEKAIASLSRLLSESANTSPPN